MKAGTLATTWTTVDVYRITSVYSSLTERKMKTGTLLATRHERFVLRSEHDDSRLGKLEVGDAVIYLDTIEMGNGTVELFVVSPFGPGFVGPASWSILCDDET